MKANKTLFLKSALTVAVVASLPVALTGCNTTSGQQNNLVASVEVANPSNFSREKQALYYSYNTLGVNPSDSLVGVSDGQPIPSQPVDIDADGSADGLQVALDLKAAETRSFTIVDDAALAATPFPKLTQAELSHKEGGHWVPHTKTEGFQEYVGGSFKNVQQLTPPKHYTDHSNWIRYEGPGIESDKVAYRIYLDWRNGVDIFGKSVAEPVLQNVGLDGYESYHHLQDWGMDILKVGNSLGSGGFGFWDGEKVQMVSDVDKWTGTVVNNGPIYSSVKIDYHDWTINGQTLDLSSHMSMVAGSRLVYNRLEMSEKLPNLAIGVVKHPNTDFIVGDTDITGDAYTYIASWGRQTLNDDQLGMAVIFRKRDFEKVVDDPASYTAVMNVRDRHLDYYYLAAWEGEHNNGIATKEAFIQYLDQEVEKLTQTPRERLTTRLSQAAKAGDMTAAKALEWSSRLADSELQRKTLKYHAGGWDTNRRRPPKFEYDLAGLLPYAYSEVGAMTGNSEFTSVLDKVTATYVNDDGSIKAYKASHYNIDSVAPGRAILELYKASDSDAEREKYRIATTHLREQLEHHPKTSEGAFWHKEKYPWQVWLDGVYMGMPFLAEYSMMFEQGASLDEVVNEFVLSRKYLRDPATGLYYHAWDEKKQQDWADPHTGLSPHFWARGMGWFAMALVDVLDIIPEDRSDLRKPLLDISVEVADALKASQDPATGTWWQIMNMPGETGNYRESSATAMFAYFYAKAIRKGYIPESYRSTALAAYNGLINEFVLVRADGTISMTNQCLVAGLGFGRNGSYRYYMSERIYQDDPKGTGPFILAGVEISRLLQDK